jgi:putative phosphoesterase
MRIGVVSDTHNNLPNVRKIVALFNEAGVDRVVHTGDITQPKVLHAFSELNAPMVGVFGNNDHDPEGLATLASSLGFDFSHPPLELNWHSRKILVVHDPRDFEGILDASFQLALHGHTHLYTHYEGENGVLFNPGESAGLMAGYNRIGIVDLETLKAEVLYF